MCHQDSPRAAVIPCVPPQEYFKAVDTKLLTAPVINVAFQDNSTFRVPTRLTCTAPSDRVDNTVSEHAVCILQVKKARGAIVRHMCLRHATEPSELKSFTGAAMTPAARVTDTDAPYGCNQAVWT